MGERTNLHGPTVTTSSAAERPTHIRYIVLLVLCLATVINYVQRNCLGPAESTIERGLHLSETDLGDMMGVFFLAYSLMQIPSGWLAQKWGPRRALTIFAIGWSVALGFSALAVGYWGLFGSRAAMGVLQAGIFPCCTLAIMTWLPLRRRAFATAMLNSFMLLGGAVGSWVAGRLLGPIGWRGLFAGYAAPGIAWAVFFWFWFRDRPQDHPAVNEAELAIISGRPIEPVRPSGGLDRTDRIIEPGDHGDKVAANIGAVALNPMMKEKAALSGDEGSSSPPTIRKRTTSLFLFLSLTLWLVCLQQFFRSGANRFYDHWMPKYLETARGCDVQTAAALSSWPQYGGVLGGLVGGLLSDWVLFRTGSRRAGRQGVAIGSLLVGTLLYWAAFGMSDVTTAVLLTSAGYFIASFSAPCAYALTMDLGGHNLGVVFGTMNMCGNFGSMAFTWAVPHLNKLGGWDATLYVFAGAHVAAALCWLLVNPEGVIGEPKKGASL